MHKSLQLTLVASAVAALSACGGGGGGSGDGGGGGGAGGGGGGGGGDGAAGLQVRVIDGPLQGVTVCLDANEDEQCGNDEVSAVTGADGRATLDAPADERRFPVLALVPVGAVDADGGPVTQPYTLLAPAGQPQLVSPWTTLVVEQMRSAGTDMAEAAEAVRRQAGLAISPLDDYAAAGHVPTALAARVLVAGMQAQLRELQPMVGQLDVDDEPMDAALVSRTVRNRLGQLAVGAVHWGARLSREDACAAPASDGCRQRIDEVAGWVVDAQALQPQSLPVYAFATRVLAMARALAGGPVQQAQPGISLDWVSPGDAGNWYYRAFTTSTAQTQPDASGRTASQVRRVYSANGTVTMLANHEDPARAGDLHWNGSDWVNCTLDSLTRSTLRSADGVNRSSYCDGFSESVIRQVPQSLEGIRMQEVVDLIALVRPGFGAPRNGFAAPNLGDARFPAGSAVLHRWTMDVANAVSYDVRDSNRVQVFPAETAAGGDELDGNTPACTVPANRTQTPADTLETMIARFAGTPCKFASQGTITVGGTAYTSPQRVQWSGQSTLSLGRLNYSASTPAYWTNNELLRLAFTGPQEVSYYSCLERWTDGMVGDCRLLGTGRYSIGQLGDARVLTLDNVPGEASWLSYERVFVERGGAVYQGFRNKPGSNAYVPRLNGAAGNALLSALGMPTITLP